MMSKSVYITVIQSLSQFFSPTLENFSIYSNKFFHNFHLSESNFTYPGLRASGLALGLVMTFLQDQLSLLNNVFLAWDDGKIRGYGFDKGGKSLKEKFVRGEAHSKGVTAIACTSDGNRIISGGGEGQVRIWDINRSMDMKGNDVYILKLTETMMEHKGTVADVKVVKGDTECATASNDGTCIIWDLE